MFGFIRLSFDDNGSSHLDFPCILHHLCLQYTGYLLSFPFRSRMVQYFNQQSSILHQNLALQTNLLYAISIGLHKYFWSSVHLIFKGSVDGMNGAAFHKKCDGMSNTVTLLRTESGHIFGGFTCIPWSCDQKYHCDKNAFLFSLQSKVPLSVKDNDKNQVRIYRLRKGQGMNAVFHYESYGPIFGLGHDLSIFSINDDRNSQSCTHSFDLNEEFIGEMYFKAIEIEIYQFRENVGII